MPVKLERFVRVMTFGHGVTDNLVNIRNGKVKVATAEIKAAIDAAAVEGFGIASLQATYDSLEKRRVDAMALNGNKARCDALDVIKADARAAASTAAGTASNCIRNGKHLLVDMRMAEGMCRVFAGLVKNGVPVTSGPPPDVKYLDMPAKDTPKLIKDMRALMASDVERVENELPRRLTEYHKAVARYKKEILAPPLIKRANDLIASDPDGPEAKMKEALGPRFEVSLVQVVQTAEAFGVNNDKLSPGEQVAVFTYTKQDYRPMNKLLLGVSLGDDEPPESDGLAKLQIKCDQARAALKKLDPYVGITTRGEHDWPGADAQYVVGNEFAIKAFWSSGVGFAFSGKYNITIDGRSGCDVAGLSNSPNEAEILFAPGAKFKVISRVDKSPNAVIIKVREIA